MPDDEALDGRQQPLSEGQIMARLVQAGFMPSLVEAALDAADEAGQVLPTEFDVARDSTVTAEDIALAQAFWWYDRAVPAIYKRILTARPREAPDAA